MKRFLKNFYKYKSLVFDCDGVLLDSNKIKSDAFYELAKAKKKPQWQKKKHILIKVVHLFFLVSKISIIAYVLLVF